MGAANTVLRLIGATLTAVVIMFVLAVGYHLLDPIYNGVINTSLMTSLGWGKPQDVVMLFAGIGLVGLIVVVIVWWITGEIRSDVRQNPGGPPFP